MVQSSFWRETLEGDFEDCSGELEIRSCTNDDDWPIELAAVNNLKEPIGLSLNMVDSIRVYYQLYQRFGKMFS